MNGNANLFRLESLKMVTMCVNVQILLSLNKNAQYRHTQL